MPKVFRCYIKIIQSTKTESDSLHTLNTKARTNKCTTFHILNIALFPDFRNHMTEFSSCLHNACQNIFFSFSYRFHEYANKRPRLVLFFPSSHFTTKICKVFRKSTSVSIIRVRPSIGTPLT